jgi:hypothetical protein
MRDSPGNEEMQQLQPLLHTEEINSTSVWPIIHMIRAVRSTLLSFVLSSDARPGCCGNSLIVALSLRV